MGFRPEGRDSREQIEAQMERPDTAFLGVFDDDLLVAVGLATFDGRKGWINRVAVDPDHRREGLGGEVIRECEAFLKSQGATVIACLIEDWNLPSIALFQKHGFLCYEGVYYLSKRDSADA